jgi:outer membrane protein OmpA-like peptidoglycan-associated protein
METGLSSTYRQSFCGLMTILSGNMTMNIDGLPWRELERQLAESSSFDRLMEREEEMESRAFESLSSSQRSSPKGDAQIRWLQRALNQVSGFKIPENGVLSVPTRRALQKFQAEQGLRPTGILSPRTQSVLIEITGIPTPQLLAGDDDSPLSEMESPSGRCPIDTLTVIRGFNQYSDDILLLPPSQQTKLAVIATDIASSQSGAPGVTPVTQVLVVGHADLDAAREKREPGFVQFMSEKRALAVFEDLFCKVTAKTRPRVPDVRWMAVGRGAKTLAVSNPRTEAERKCNRRVEITLVRSPHPSPRLDDNQRLEVAADHGSFRDIYHVALQGTWGKYDSPQAAEKAAREIAHRALPFLEQRVRNKRNTAPGCEDSVADFLPYFKDAIQGTASRFEDPNVVIQKAAETADSASLGLLQETRRLEWKHASLSQPMAPDCEIVRGKVPGPANHALCRSHDHILDTSTKMVIAHDLDEYGRRFRR